GVGETIGLSSTLITGGSLLFAGGAESSRLKIGFVSAGAGAVVAVAGALPDFVPDLLVPLDGVQPGMTSSTPAFTFAGSEMLLAVPRSFTETPYWCAMLLSDSPGFTRCFIEPVADAGGVAAPVVEAGVLPLVPAFEFAAGVGAGSAATVGLVGMTSFWPACSAALGFSP